MYMEPKKMVLINLFAGQQWRRGYKEQTCGHSGEGAGGMKWEGSAETHTSAHGKQTATGHLLPDAGSSDCGSVTNHTGGTWREAGGGPRGRGHMYNYGRFMLMYGRKQHNICCKAIILQLKIKYTIH